MKQINTNDKFKAEGGSVAKKVRDIAATMKVGDVILAEPFDDFYHMARSRFSREGGLMGMKFVTRKTKDGIQIKRIS